MGFTLQMAKKEAVHSAMRGLQPLIKFMERWLPGSVQLRHDVASTTGVFMGGGAHDAIIYSKLSICVPAEIYWPVRIA